MHVIHDYRLGLGLYSFISLSKVSPKSYTPTTTDPTAFLNPSLHTTNKHKAYLCKWRQNGTRWCESVVVSLIPI